MSSSPKDSDRPSEILRRLKEEKGVKTSDLFSTASEWVSFRDTIFERILTIAVTKFTAPILPGDKAPVRDLLANIPEPTAAAADSSSSPSNSSETSIRRSSHLLPTPIIAQLEEIRDVLLTFDTEPPHTAQRLAELILQPRRHYNHLVPWLHALDRVVHVTSGMDTYPLPAPAAPALSLDGGDIGVSWGAATQTINPGSDEALGGALLTPIPWLQNRAASADAEAEDDVDMDMAAQQPDSPEATATAQGMAGPEIRTQSTMKIDGPNGMGSIETVTVSLNGISSVTARPAATVANSSSSSNNSSSSAWPETRGGEDEDNEDDEDDEAVEHARGPKEIGVADLGPQKGDVFGQTPKPEDIDYDKAAGRKHDEDDVESKALEDDEMDGVETGSKRGADDDDDDQQQAEGAAKKIKADTSDDDKDAAEETDEKEQKKEEDQQRQEQD